MSEPGVKIVMTVDGPVSQAVMLGRDARKRPYRRELLRPWRRRFECLCCSAYTLDVVDECDTCSLCGWEDWYECHDSPDEEIRPNRLSLNEARRIVTRYGAAACSHLNRAGGMTIADLDRLSPEEVASLKSVFT